MPDAACGGLSGLIPPVHSPGLSGVPHPHGPLLAAAGGQEGGVAWSCCPQRGCTWHGLGGMCGPGSSVRQNSDEDTSAQLLVTMASIERLRS